MAAILGVGIHVDMSPAGKLVNELQRKKVTAKAIGKGAKLVIPAARSRAPKRKGSGALKKSIGSKSFASKKTKTGAVAVIGARRKTEVQVQHGNKTITAIPANYAHLVEFGTRAHSLAKGATLKRKSGKGVTKGQGSGPQHPGAKPKPFMKPAWDSTKDAVGEKVATEIVKEVQKQIEKNARTAFKKLR